MSVSLRRSNRASPKRAARTATASSSWSPDVEGSATSLSRPLKGRPLAAAGTVPAAAVHPESSLRLVASQEDSVMRVLVIEDDLEAQRYLVKGLREAGHVVD